MITANDVIATLKSLKRKIDKETGKEHNSISEGVETLILGYGSGSTETWDGVIYVDGDIAKDVTDYYEEGRQAGLDEADRIIYGAFILNDGLTPCVEQTVILSEPAGVYANFYNGSAYEKELIHSFAINPSGNLVVITNYNSTKTVTYSYTDGVWLYSSGGSTGELPDEIGKIIEFSEPVVVASALFEAFDEISSTDIENTIVTMVDERLINVSEEGM